MSTRRFTSLDGFLVRDYDDAPSAGMVRLATKVLVDGATWLARSQTYQFASFERCVVGASAAINSTPDARDDAVASFIAEVAEIEPAVALTAGRGVRPEELSALRSSDPRPAQWWESAATLQAAGIVAAAETALGGLDGIRVIIDGVDGAGVGLLTALAARGARIVGVSIGTGSVLVDAGIDSDALVQAMDGDGDRLAAVATAAGVESQAAGALFSTEADLALVGSKVGVVDDGVAGRLTVKAVVPHSPLPVTAKALAVLGRAGVTVLPDFLTTAGHLVAWPVGTGSPSADPDAAARLVSDAIAEVLGHERGPVLAACERAEAFLLTWRDELPFGRPIG